MVQEYLEFKNNKDLNYFNFNLIDEAITIDKEKGIISDELSLILYYVKQAHEFTKGYYN